MRRGVEESAPGRAIGRHASYWCGAPQQHYEIAPREALIVEIMELIDDAASCDEPVSSSDLAEQIVELVDEKLISDAASAEAMNAQGTDGLMNRIASASAAKFHAKRNYPPDPCRRRQNPKSERFRFRLTRGQRQRLYPLRLSVTVACYGAALNG